MFGLRQQISRRQRRVSFGVGDDHRLGGTEDAVYADIAIDLLLRQRNEEITGADYRGDMWDALCAVSHGGYRLGAANPVQFFHASDGGCCQDRGVNVAHPTAGWRTDDYFRHAGHLRRNHAHQQR